MKPEIKEERDKKINNFILNCLKNRPLSASQILDNIKKEEDEKGKPKFKVNTLIGLRKDHLKFLEEGNLIFRLDRTHRIIDTTSYKLEAPEFLEKFWSNRLRYKEEEGKWGKGKQKNYYHGYYFATPKTAKWTKILNEVILERIILKFEEYLYDTEKMKQTLKELINAMKMIETLPIYNDKRTKKQKRKDIEEHFNKEIEKLNKKLKDVEEEKEKPLFISKEHEIELIKKDIKEQESSRDSLLWFLEEGIFSKPKPVTKEEFIEKKGKIFGFDCIERDFSPHLGHTKNLEMFEIVCQFASDLMHSQGRLHELIFLQEIKIDNILEEELKKKLKSYQFDIILL